MSLCEDVHSLEIPHLSAIRQRSTDLIRLQQFDSTVAVIPDADLDERRATEVLFIFVQKGQPGSDGSCELEIAQVVTICL